MALTSPLGLTNDSTMPKNPHAVALGKMRSRKKAAASRRNGRLGGRKTLIEELKKFIYPEPPNL